MPTINVRSYDRFIPHRKSFVTYAALAAVGAATASSAYAEQITPPSDAPPEVRVDAGHRPFLLGRGAGTQNYVCLPSGGGFRFTLITPRATLSSDDDKQLTTHYFSPNPSENPPPAGQISNGTIRPTWQHSRDGSFVWARVEQGHSAIVKADSVAWLKLTVSGVERGPTGGDILTFTTFIQRVNTVGGLAPDEGCSSPLDVGTQAIVPYTADYIFYRAE
jgi:hypothetical protein